MREERRLAREKALEEEKKVDQIKEEEIEEENEEEEEKNTHPRLKLTIFIIIVLIILSYIYVKEIGSRFIQVNEYKIETKDIPDSFNGLKIVHFSDIHYGTTINEKELKTIIKKINEIKPDVVFFTGDLFDKDITINEDTTKKLVELLSQIEPTLYKYAIYGDMDNPDKFAEIMEKSNFIILNNESKLLYYNGNTPIVITGLNPKPNNDIINAPIEDIDTSSLYSIVLMHQPDNYDNIKLYSPSLTLSGHSLGGLVEIPYLKPLFLQEGAKKYYKDHYKINDNDFYISSGLGTYKIPFRINNRPSINFYRIYKIS